MMTTPISATAKIAKPLQVWASPATKPECEWAVCRVLIQWFDVPEVFECTAEWREGRFFHYRLWNDGHQIPSEDSGGVKFLGWRYAEEVFNQCNNME